MNSSIRILVILFQSITVLASGSSPGSYSALQNSLVDYFPLYDSNFVSPPNKVESSPKSTDYRLPINVIPSHYVLKQNPILDVTPGLTRFTAPGEVTITVNCTLATSVITLHRNQEKVTITEEGVKITDTTGADVPIVSHAYDEAKEFYNITLAGPLTVGATYYIFIPFVAIVSTDSPFGLSGAAYIDPANPDEPSYLSVTTLEPHYARRVFPCFDEPDLKATFDIVLGHTAAYQTLAHTPIKEKIIDGDWIWDHYERTVVMPTYLICMVVVSATAYKGVLTSEEHFRVPVKAWGATPVIDRGGGDFAAETAAKSLSYFENTYKFEYSLEKLDSIVIPGFPAGALENWGINTYRENVLVWEANENTQANKAASSSTISHEISHQWFGNLVSCRYWEHIWLNEGLANYMAFRGVAHTHPEFESHVSFPSDSVQPAMKADQGPNTHPVLFEQMPADWMEIFDTISYSKGGSLLKMAEGFLTEEIITEGFIDYLQKKAYQGAEQDDLFASFDAAAGRAQNNPLPDDLSVKQILDTWTLQSGYPLIRVTKAGTKRIYLSQEQFTLTPPGSNGMWHIPLKIVTKSNPDTTSKIPNLWMRNNALLVSYTDGIDTSEWIMVNPDATGYFRVWYEPSLLALIQTQLESDPNVISPGSRSQLLDDYWNFPLGNYEHIDTALDLTKYLGKETKLVVWSSVLGNLNPTFVRLSGSPGFVPFESYLRPRIDASLDLIGWEQTPTANGTTVVLRALLLNWACGFGSAKCQNEAERLYTIWRNQADPNPVPIPIDVQAVHFCGAVAKVGRDAYTFILDRYKNTVGGLKTRLLGGLACATDPAVISDLLAAALDLTEIQAADRTLLLQRIAGNPSGRATVYEFIKTNLAHANLGPNVFANVVSTLSTHWHTAEDLANLEEFIADNGPALEGVIASLEASKRIIQGNMDWMTTTGNLIVDWMTNNADI